METTISFLRSLFPPGLWHLHRRLAEPEDRSIGQLGLRASVRVDSLIESMYINEWPSSTMFQESWAIV